MADTRILLSGLKDYLDSLMAHLEKLQASFEELSSRWSALSSVYEGNAADQFRAGWMNTTENFTEYIEETRKISDLLEERIEALGEADRSTEMF